MEGDVEHGTACQWAPLSSKYWYFFWRRTNMVRWALCFEWHFIASSCCHNLQIRNWRMSKLRIWCTWEACQAFRAVAKVSSCLVRIDSVAILKMMVFLVTLWCYRSLELPLCRRQCTLDRVGGTIAWIGPHGILIGASRNNLQKEWEETARRKHKGSYACRLDIESGGGGNAFVWNYLSYEFDGQTDESLMW